MRGKNPFLKNKWSHWENWLRETNFTNCFSIWELIWCFVHPTFWIWKFPMFWMNRVRWRRKFGWEWRRQRKQLWIFLFPKIPCSHQEIPAWEEERRFHLPFNSLSLHEKTSFNLPVFPNRQKLVERFGSGRCFRILHSFSQKDQKFGHLWQNEECGCGEKVAWTVLCDCYQCLSWDFRRICIRPRTNHQHLMVIV